MDYLKRKATSIKKKATSIKNAIVGDDEKGEFQQTKLANCIITPNDDEDTLEINKPGLEAISKHFHNMISLVGPPGVGMFNFYQLPL